MSKYGPQKPQKPQIEPNGRALKTQRSTYTPSTHRENRGATLPKHFAFHKLNINHRLRLLVARARPIYDMRTPGSALLYRDERTFNARSQCYMGIPQLKNIRPLYSYLSLSLPLYLRLFASGQAHPHTYISQYRNSHFGRPNCGCGSEFLCSSQSQSPGSLPRARIL